MKRNNNRRRLPSMAIEPPADPPAAPAPPPRHLSILKTQETMVTPDMADRWLKGHTNVRAINWRSVEAMANDMRAGRWTLSHQAICFDGAGHLIDGQHRLNAVVQSGVAVPMLVVTNPEGSARDAIDRGRPRALHVIMGRQTSQVSSANMLRMFETGYELHTPMTLAEAEGALERHAHPLGELSKLPKITKLWGPVLAACVWSYPCDPRHTSDFAVDVATGEMIGRGNPAFAFRNWLERNRGAKSWDRALAALNCLRHAITDSPLALVSIGPIGYRAVCARRRALKIPNTPPADLVPGTNWIPSSSRGGGGDESEGA